MPHKEAGHGVYTLNPSTWEIEEDQEFKVITSYTQFKASLGYIKLTERGETDRQTN